MNIKDIANKYLLHLEKGEINKVIALFNTDGIIDSPIYGIKKADAFYKALNNDTSNSKLYLKRIFENKDSNEIAIYFTYKWTLQNNQKVEFDVVDIIEFDSENKIKKLKIIYDTVDARQLIRNL